MKKVYNSYFDETYYTETLSNGLKVVIFHKPDFSSTNCAFGTPYGALMINEKLGNKEYHFNPGIAHFIEHKLFEAKGDDMMAAFSSMGAEVNAFTSYRETVYYFSKTGKDIKKPLNLLLDFVQDLNISEESVEKEKGIIAQEVSMYEQQPDSRLLREAYKCMYHNDPIKYDIGGDKKSIYAITKKELEECYKLNYHPSNMLLSITTPIDPKKIIKIVKENQDKKKFDDRYKLTINNKDEPVEVVKKTYSFKMPIATSKHLLAYKIKPNFKNANEAFKAEWCLRFLLEAHFSPLNPKYQTWLDEGIINEYFGFEIDFDPNLAYVMFYIENDDKKVLKKLINESIREKLLTKDLLTQIKRRYIGQSFEIFNEVEAFNLGYIRDSLNGLDFFKALNELKSISLKDVEKVWESLDFSNETYVSMLKNEK